MACDANQRPSLATNSSSVKLEKRSIALFGTSADPPTFGHQALLKGLLTLFPTVITWASDNPKKQHIASLETRTKLLDALVESIDNPNLELIQELSSPWTIGTLDLATKRWPEAKLVFVVGSDLTREIPTWLHPRKVLHKAFLGIAPRDGWPLREDDIQAIKNLGGRIELLPLSIPSSASSNIRKNPNPNEIPTAVLKVLKSSTLYGLNKSNY